MAVGCEVNLVNINIEEVYSKFSEDIQPNFEYENPDGSVKVYIKEIYYYRIKSNLSATIIFEQQDTNKYFVYIVVSGGASGLFGITWGAENNMMKKLAKYFERFGGVVTPLEK
ncbi:MAG: hypothetical protein JW891_11980 [Candidatus Lokiarchaeota archaeon]|nr:hypothetical protein [Candidatus Lokiarchaeota archaeon]